MTRGWWWRVVWVAVVCVTLVSPLAREVPAVAAQEAAAQAVDVDEEAWLDETLAGMSTADKVGQLFLVTFRGTDSDLESDAAYLIQNLRVGGVLLAPENENFDNSASAVQPALSLTTSLQWLAFSESAPFTITDTLPVTVTLPPRGIASPEPEERVITSTLYTYTQVMTTSAQNIPLFIAVVQEGDGAPYTALRNGFTPLPSNLAVGATWDPARATAVGRILGRELAAVGVNLLLGPSLDVVNDPRPGQSGDLGTRVFGGDPYWVGRMGEAYIRGVHLGSDGQVATVGKHLPGLGASDRSLEEEIATVDKSHQELRLIELPPFFAVTGGGVVTDTADALMTAHIRYRGFQGNIHFETPPISLYPQGLQQIMNQAELIGWRQNGGMLVSDSLGVPAVRRNYSAQLDSFPHRQIALDAFQAGNDLLNLSRFSLTDSWEAQMRNVEDTILFFRGRYETDDTFRARVDQSVRRILRLKHRICPEFTFATCTGSSEASSSIGTAQATVAQIAQEAVTLLYPSTGEMAMRLPRPPRLGEEILIFTDAREVRDCALCPPFYQLDPEALRNTILQLYGPGASGQVDPSRITSYTFADLHSYLAFGTPDLQPLLRDADWILFATLDYAPVAYPSSAALKEFLRDWQGGLEAKNVVVMAYAAPYYLDTTEVSKLTAHYGLYSKAAPFIDVSVRALFQEFAPAGRSPVAVDGVGYYLSRQLSPDPVQQIAVNRVDVPPEDQGTPKPVKLDVGDPLRVSTSVIVDRNGHPVPDGTQVTFHAYYVQEQLESLWPAVTLDGVAEATITLEMAGTIEIRATSDPAISSRPLVVMMGETTVFLTPTPTVTPTPTATPTPTPTPTPTDTPTATPTITPSPTAVPVVEEPPPPVPRLEWVDLMMALVGIATAAGAVAAAVHGLMLPAAAADQLGRLILWSVVCGLAAYVFYGFALPGSSVLEAVTPGVRGFSIGFLAGLLPLLYAIGWSWQVRRAQVRG
ncbi:MAG TPA: glycoside hydrolase family 3 N-terminal domain-containing protein [Anaerolineae bacterium]|nr:glycoside hydrolase family 3 N-terminal domain-containing protein [Anaerolineae bacterium]